MEALTYAAFYKYITLKGEDASTPTHRNIG